MPTKPTGVYWETAEAAGTSKPPSAGGPGNWADGSR